MIKFSRLIPFVVCLVASASLLGACRQSPPADPTVTERATVDSPVPTEPQSLIRTPSPALSSPVLTPRAIPTPEEGKASVVGTLYTFSGDAPIPGTVFYLTPPREGTDDPPRVLSGPSREAGDIQGASDNAGQFVLTNVAPGKYYVAVWAPYDWILAVESPTARTPRLITLSPDEQRDLGRVDVAWP